MNNIDREAVVETLALALRQMDAGDISAACATIELLREPLLTAQGTTPR